VGQVPVQHSIVTIQLLLNSTSGGGKAPSQLIRQDMSLCTLWEAESERHFIFLCMLYCEI
jgi:hypothetical protein